MMDSRKIKKAAFPVAGFGTRFLPATKATLKQPLPIVDKLLIQYAVEEAISSDIESLITVTGRNKRTIEDHFEEYNESETMLRAKGKDAQANMVRNIGRLVMTPDFFDTPRGLKAGLGGEIQAADAININAQQGSVETMRQNGQPFDCGPVDGFMQVSAHVYEQRLVV